MRSKNKSYHRYIQVQLIDAWHQNWKRNLFLNIKISIMYGLLLANREVILTAHAGTITRAVCHDAECYNGTCRILPAGFLPTEFFGHMSGGNSPLETAAVEILTEKALLIFNIATDQASIWSYYSVEKAVEVMRQSAHCCCGIMLALSVTRLNMFRGLYTIHTSIAMPIHRSSYHPDINTDVDQRVKPITVHPAPRVDKQRFRPSILNNSLTPGNF